MRTAYPVILSLLAFSCNQFNEPITNDVIDNEIRFVLSGSGFDSSSFRFASSKNSRLNGARYNVSSGSTVFIVTDQGITYENLFNIIVHGRDTGAYSLAEPSLNAFRLFLNVTKDSTIDIYPMRDTIQAGAIVLSKFPEVGGKIEGSFSTIGADIRKWPSPKFQVTGTFSILRLSDIN